MGTSNVKAMSVSSSPACSLIGRRYRLTIV
jgi:hypothetical protein